MEKLIFQARLAEDAERYESMFCFAKKIMKEAETLDNEIRNVITIAFNNAVRKQISEWRVIACIELKERSLGRIEMAGLTKVYRQKIEDEVTDMCVEVLRFIESWMQNQNQVEIKIYLLKLKEKVYRNLAELQTHQLNIDAYGTDSRDKQLRAQEEALRLARTELSPINPIRLGLALSLAAFTYDINRDPITAISIAKEAFDLAIPLLEDISDESYKDVTLIMSLLRDNLTLWCNE